MPPRTWDFHIHRERTGDVLVLRLAGRLGAAAVTLLRDALATPEQVAVVVDLEGLDYISGAGLGALRDAAGHAAAAGQPFALCGIAGSVRIAFELAGMLGSLPVEADRSEAVARVRVR